AADTPVGTAEQQAALPMGVAAPLMTKNANLCVQIQGDSTANGAFLIAATCNNSAGQMWKLMPQGVGYKIVNTLTNKCIDVNAWSTDDGGV
ncbi:RICIN domain-containing protein, partial [Acinetobacter baumannii]